MTIRLEPCGTATARLVDANGRPIAGYRDEYMISMIITPGSRPGKPRPRRREAPCCRSGLPDQDRPDQLREGARVGRPGPNHIPGSDPRCELSNRRPHDRREPSGPQVRKDFTVKPGETLDLGDILIEKPQTR